MKKYFNRAILFFSLAIAIVSFCSWGFFAHETITQLAVYKLPPQLRRFFFSNIDSLVASSIRPDKRRSTDRTESAKHFIDLEAFGDSAAYKMPWDWQAAVEKHSLDTLKKYGFLPYQILFEYDSLVNAFRRRNADSIIFYADDLAHYIEDANVPLHTTINYDGQLTNQKGLHALWESTIPELEVGNYNLYKSHKARYLRNKQAAVWMAIRRAHGLLPAIFEKEKEVAQYFPDGSKHEERMYYGRKTKVYTDAFAKKYAAALAPTINDQINNSANMVSDFWFSAWVDAGRPNLRRLYSLNKADRKNLHKELRAYKRNNLVSGGLLRANRE